MILHIHANYNKRLGAYKITHVLQRDYGVTISVGRVYRLMKQIQLPKMSTDKPTSNKYCDNNAYDNHLNQNFTQKAPNLVWVGDITYLKAGSKWYFLCIIMDLFSRKVISWSLSAKNDADSVISTFKKAYEKRNSPYGLMFHSDRGSQFTAFSFRKLLDSLDVVQSFSQKGYPYDNACCECFFKYLKKEETNRKNYQTKQELFLALFEYIEGFYNTKRPHTTLNMLTLNEAEALYWR